ncbi:MAG: fructosamine kinase family protein [Verrucomicrobiota bacterium]
MDPTLRWVRDQSGLTPIPSSVRSTSGGCIHQTSWIATEEGPPLFLKQNQASQLAVFQAEEKGLSLLRQAKAIRIPEPIACGLVGTQALFLMEGIPLHPSRKAEAQARLGHQLAHLHAQLAENGRYGAPFDNHIGATPQTNHPEEDWPTFFLHHRILPQRNQALAKRSWPLLEAFPLEDVCLRILSSTAPSPSLLHGDLWSRNVAFDEQEQPVLFDPATYYGDAETDLAFTHMFGGFTPAFYQAYRDRQAPPPDESKRHRLYNLYHELNHWNLFGGGYASQVEATLSDLHGDA